MTTIADLDQIIAIAREISKPRERRESTLAGQQHVLATLRQLLPAAGELTLDEIDGEFYWRCCRQDVFEPIMQLRHALKSVRLFTGGGSLVEVIRDLKVAHAVADCIEYGMNVFGEACPPDVYDCLLTDRRIAMSAPFGYRDDVGGTGMYRYMHVPSALWTGSHVEERIRALGDNHTRSAFWAALASEWIGDPIPQWSNAGSDEQTGEADAEGVAITAPNVRLRLITEEKQQRMPQLTARRFPYVEVRVREPLPPPGYIAFDYDKRVREINQWHLQLVGINQAQEPLVAMRTWSAALLIGLGRPVANAISDVVHEMGLNRITPQKFNKDRDLLLERVPDADPFVFDPTRTRPFAAKHANSMAVEPDTMATSSPTIVNGAGPY